MKEIILKKDTEVFLSEVGYYNWVYPKEEESTILTKDIKATRLMWWSGMDVNKKYRWVAYNIKDEILKIHSGLMNIIWIKELKC